MIRGFDVSAVQGAIRWDKVPSDTFRFVYARCGNGNSRPDGEWSVNRGGAVGDAGLILGAYHVLFPLPHIDPVTQAEAHWIFQGSTRDLVPMADLEWPREQAVRPRDTWAFWGCTGPQIRDFSLRYLRRMRQLAGNAGVYMDRDFRRSIACELEPELGSFPLWEADWTASPHPFAPWPGWSVWQESGGGLLVPGIASKVDEDGIADEDTLSRLRA